MNASSLAHSYVQNQQKSSWTDDPFQFGTHVINGLKPMSHKRKLSDYAEELVDQYGKYVHEQYQLTIDMLPESSQNELARLFIESIDRELDECIYGNDLTINNDFTSALLLMLKNDCDDTRNNFAEVTRKNILTYYKESIQLLLNEACHDFLLNMNEENNIYQYVDRETGELCSGHY